MSSVQTRFSIAAIVMAALSVLVLTGTAEAEPPERPTETLSPDPTATADPNDERPVTWEGTLATGTNSDYNATSGEPCGDGIDDQCDTTLLHVNVPAGFWSGQSGGVEVSLDNYLPNPASDFDLYIYESDASGNRGALVDSSGGVPGLPEHAEIPEADGYYLVQVVYFAVTASRYSAQADFFLRPEPAPVPPDVDQPSGLEDSLASNPQLGFRSHSEPHIAQSPTNPDLLVAGSKMYNRDPDSLAEYEFKIGTYVSFDGGKSWSDLGQLGVCPPNQAPPSSWPNNDCYPDEDPALGGTGQEDVDDPTDPGDASDPRGSGDFGEEYITSDVWVQFDDEGNAYAMVLDSPPFANGNGWGMSFHRWESPSPADVQSGDTWGPKIVINNYTNPSTQPLFLDDKNTFAVNNAGPDNDGQTGPMVACWGQNIDPLIKQQTVCERSTDGGSTWPGQPIPVSPPDQQLVIGVSVVADNVDPNRFYAMWLHYTPSVAGVDSEYWAAQSLDGGQTWGPAILVTQVTPIPTQFPGQGFRNLSIPIMAAGPSEGELYATYAEYRNAASSQDFDGMQADIMLVKSTNGGVTWSSPSVVNGDGTDADQFQPTVAVTPSGQLNIAYFDRRHDPDNFYIDTYLSRSNDAGATFTDVRVSHDMWDPSINPPISGSGEFIGDYQGLVADDCNAIPFVNDTHLANDPGRDPDFDQGDPRSQFQEVFSWQVPNSPALGGQPVAGANCSGGAGESPPPDGGQGQGPVKCSKVEKGNGTDEKLKGTPESETLRGKGGDDQVRGKGGDDCLFGNRGDDEVDGGQNDDELHGGRGADELDGGGGEDEFAAGARRDEIDSDDGVAEEVRCGKGADEVIADRKDDLHGCETVRR